MAITIRDIAKMVGVSPSTVSRTLTGNATISEETKKKIWDAMEQLNYHPNSVARSLANGASMAIAMIINADDQQSFANPFFQRSLLAVERIMQQNGYNLIISNDSTPSRGESPVEKLMLERKVDGLIVPPSTATPKLLARMAKNSFPFVILGEPDKGALDCDWVDVDNRDGARQAVQHLYAMGYLRPAYLGGNERERFVHNRVKGYRDAFSSPELATVLETDGYVDMAYGQVMDMLRQSAPPDSFLCNDNLCAYGALKAIHDLGLSCPADIGIVTFDDQPLAPFLTPALTAVDIDTAALGEQAARMLLARIEKPGAHQHILISASLLARESSKRRAR